MNFIYPKQLVLLWLKFWLKKFCCIFCFDDQWKSFDCFPVDPTITQKFKTKMATPTFDVLIVSHALPLSQPF
jgi:hypothetical protein